MSYGWPLKPFDRAHPVRGYFNDPRISGTSRAFHFGVDISAPNGTPVHAVRGGVVHIEGRRSLAVSDAGVDFGYWHIVPAVQHRQRIQKGHIVGHVQEPWLHVHFAEHRADGYRDPLRRGALEPWVEDTKPNVTRVVFSRDGRALTTTIAGAVDVIAEAHDTTPLRVPEPWNDLPVTPARIRWRVRRGGLTVRPWRMPVDFTKGLLPKEDFHRIYAPRTRQNKAGKPGLYRFFLAHTWSTRLLPDGNYELDVEAFDNRGNKGSLQQAFTIANNV